MTYQRAVIEYQLAHAALQFAIKTGTNEEIANAIEAWDRAFEIRRRATLPAFGIQAALVEYVR